MLKAIRKKLGLYDLRKEIGKWVEENIGPEYVEEALDKYDKINRGIPIGGFAETVAYLNMIERVKEDMPG